jgi:uncharacterized protein YbaR (Trm112 family)
MVIIFGWGSGEAQDLGEVAPVVCPNCHNDVFLHDIRSEKRVSLFFVPLASYGNDRYLACPICRHGLQVPPAQGGAVDQMRMSTNLYRRGGLLDQYYRPKVEQFWHRLGVSPSGQQMAQPAPEDPQVEGPQAVGAAAPGPSLADQLAGYGKLHAEGVLTDEEFAAVKRRLLGM